MKLVSLIADLCLCALCVPSFLMLSIKSEFYPPHLFSLLAVTFIHLKVKEQLEDNPDLLLSPGALTSSLLQANHLLNFHSD